MNTSNNQQTQKPAANQQTVQASNALEDLLKNSTVSVASISAKGAGDGNSSVHSTMLGVRPPTSEIPKGAPMVKSEETKLQNVNNQTTRINQPPVASDKINSLQMPPGVPRPYAQILPGATPPLSMNTGIKQEGGAPMRAPQQLPQLQSTPSFQSVAASPFPSANMLAPNMSNLKAPVAGGAMGAPMKEGMRPPMPFPGQIPPQFNSGWQPGAGPFMGPGGPPGNVMRPVPGYQERGFPIRPPTSMPPQMKTFTTQSTASSENNQMVVPYMQQRQQHQQAYDKPKPELQNIVSTASLGTSLDLRKIALGCRNAEYNPRRFAAVIIRIRDPKTTALIFRSGKMVITGAKSEEKSEQAAKMYAKMIKKQGTPDVKLQDFKIQNIVGSCGVSFAISLESLNTGHSAYSTYEPELFPGLIYRMHKPKIVLLIFASGKIVLTGAKTREDIYTAFDNIYNILRQFEKKKPKIIPPPSAASGNISNTR